MVTKTTPEIQLLKSLCKGHWGPRNGGVTHFLARDDLGYALLEKLIADGQWVETLPFLLQLHAESKAMRDAKSASQAIDEMLKKEVCNGR